MKLLLDQGLARSTVDLLGSRGIEAVHVCEVGLSRSRDDEIIEYARDHGLVVATLDWDFHAILALSGAPGASVIRVRIEGLKAGPLAAVLASVISECGERLEAGAMVSVTPGRLGVRMLPLRP